MHLNFCETDENPQSASVIYTCAAIRRRNWVVNNRAGFMTKVARSSIVSGVLLFFLAQVKAFL